MMSIPAIAEELVSWSTIGLMVEVRCATEESFRVTVRRTGSAGVLWDGDFLSLGRTLDDLPGAEFTAEVLGRVVLDQSDRLGRLVYAQDDLRELLREIAATIPEPYLP